MFFCIFYVALLILPSFCGARLGVLSFPWRNLATNPVEAGRYCSSDSDKSDSLYDDIECRGLWSWKATIPTNWACGCRP